VCEVRRPAAPASETIVVPLSGGTAHAADLVRTLLGPTDPVVFPLTRLRNGGRRTLHERDWDRLALVGSPPDHEIGYGFAPLLALLVRPGQVSLVDFENEKVVSQPLLRYLGEALPFALGQFAASAIAVIMQRAAIPFARRMTPARAPAPELNRLVYIRPSVGSGSTVGGSVTHSLEVIRALRAEGVVVQAFTTDAGIAKTAAADGDLPARWHVVPTPPVVKAVPASAAAGGDVALVRSALPAARDADAIYQRHARFSLAGAVLSRLSGKPLILEFNGSETFTGRYWNPTPLLGHLAVCEDAALRAASQIIVVSEADRRALLERGFSSERIVLNPNGVDSTRFADGNGHKIRRRHGLGGRDLVIGFVGTFGPWHGAHVLAQAFTAVAEVIPEAHLLLVGDGPELPNATEIVLDAGLDKRLTVTGLVAPSDVPGYLDACDILVSPHVPLSGGMEFFGSPTKLFEYMAAEKAIIASRLGQIAEVLQHRVTAWLVEPGDIHDLIKAIHALADDPALRRSLGKRARLRASETHSWERNARRITDAYRRMAEAEGV
jgi:glycosyltransferase involved in cell wall biosynthesis